MKPLFTLSILFAFGMTTAAAQSTKENLEKIKADPKTKERAAKADVYVAKNDSIIADSISMQSLSPKNPIAPTQKKKKKKSSGK
jgi:hypothetical protein